MKFRMIAAISLSTLAMGVAVAQIRGTPAPAATAPASVIASQKIEILQSGAQQLDNGPAGHVTGAVQVAALCTSHDPSRTTIARITFAPGAREAWHTHPLGQAIIVLSGTEWIQQWGGPVREIQQGDVVWIPAGVKHWHGATPKIASTHIAIQEQLNGEVVAWMETVSDEQYLKSAFSVQAESTTPSGTFRAASTEDSQTISISRSNSRTPRNGSAQYFTGAVIVDELFSAHDPSRTTGGRVSFEPGARSAWHTHTLGQILIVTDGTGWIQQWAGPIEEIRKGDVIWIPASVKHWHGATPTTAMTHLAIQEKLNGKAVEWMEKVTDEQFSSNTQGGTNTMQNLETTIPAAPALERYATGPLTDLWKRPYLSPRDRSIVTISALIARSQTNEMPRYFNLALDNGVTPRELSEVITHLAFYSGWANATAAAEVARQVFAARMIASDQLPAISPGLLPLDKETEAKRASSVEQQFGTIAPGLVGYTTDVLFRDLWLRPGLASRDRSLVTVSALIASGQVAQVTFHLNKAMDNGLTAEQAGEVVTQLAFYAGWPNAFSAVSVVKDVIEKRSH